MHAKTFFLFKKYELCIIFFSAFGVNEKECTHPFYSCTEIAKSLHKTTEIYMDYWFKNPPDSVFTRVHVNRQEVMIRILVAG